MKIRLLLLLTSEAGQPESHQVANDGQTGRQDQVAGNGAEQNVRERIGRQMGAKEPMAQRVAGDIEEGRGERVGEQGAGYHDRQIQAKGRGHKRCGNSPSAGEDP